MDPAQRRMMAFMMPVIFGFMLWHYASGLALYWGTSNLINLAMQIGINQSHIGKEMHDDRRQASPEEAGGNPRPFRAQVGLPQISIWRLEAGQGSTASSIGAYPPRSRSRQTSALDPIRSVVYRPTVWSLRTASRIPRPKQKKSIAAGSSFWMTSSFATALRSGARRSCATSSTSFTWVVRTETSSNITLTSELPGTILALSLDPANVTLEAEYFRRH